MSCFKTIRFLKLRLWSGLLVGGLSKVGNMPTGGEEVQELKGGVEGSTVWILIDVTRNSDREMGPQTATVRGSQHFHETESVIRGSRCNSTKRVADGGI